MEHQPTHTMSEPQKISNLPALEFPSDEIMQQRRAEYLAEIQNQRKCQLSAIMPKAFANTDETRLPQRALDVALRWASNYKKAPLNLLLAGNTGVGKTRIAWRALDCRYMERGTKPHHIGAESFCRRLLREPDLMLKMCNAPLLLFDDLGKERTTPTAESAIFELVRERMDNELPTIYTTNFAPDTLKPRFAQKETGDALCRRLIESCYALPVE